LSNEITVSSFVQISKAPTQYQSQPSSFKANWFGTVGPTPGALTVTAQGTDLILTEIQYPGGVARIQNLDLNNYVVMGINDTTEGRF
jgi:hypothetical protein